MTSSNVLLFPGRTFDKSMTPPNFMVIGLQVGKLHREGTGENLSSLALPDSEKPGLFRAELPNRILFLHFWVYWYRDL